MIGRYLRCPEDATGGSLVQVGACPSAVRTPVLPDDLAFGRYLEKPSLRSRADESVAVRKAVSARDEGAEKGDLVGSRVRPERLGRPERPLLGDDVVSGGVHRRGDLLPEGFAQDEA